MGRRRKSDQGLQSGSAHVGRWMTQMEVHRAGLGQSLESHGRVPEYLPSLVHPLQ